MINAAQKPTLPGRDYKMYILHAWPTSLLDIEAGKFIQTLKHSNWTLHGLRYPPSAINNA